MKEKEAYKKGYRVTSDGEVIGVNGNALLLKDRTGYKRFSYRRYGKKIDVLVHRLQAFQKYGEGIYSEGIEVRHLNGDPSDNSWGNVAIGTHSENMRDIPKHIRVAKALYATSFVRKYNKAEVRKFYSECNSYKKTMDKFDISSKGTLHFILNN